MNEQNNEEQPKQEPRWYDSELASCIGIAVIILAMAASFAGCNYISKL